MRQLMVISAMSLFLAGCQVQPPTIEVPGSQLVADDSDVVWPRVLTFLGNQGFDVVEADREQGSILAIRQAYQDQGWAFCKPAPTRDRRNDRSRRGRGRPVNRDALVTVNLQPGDDGTVVRQGVKFTEQLINHFRNLPFTAGCRSLGTLETALLEASAERP